MEKKIKVHVYEEGAAIDFNISTDPTDPVLEITEEEYAFIEKVTKDYWKVQDILKKVNDQFKEKE